MAYEPKSVRGLGWAMVVLGSLSVTLGVAADIHFSALGIHAVEHFISAPIWSGLLVLTTGILGIFSAKKPTNKCLIVAFMVVAIFVILTCACCIGFAALGIWLGIWLDYRMCALFDYGAYYAAVERHENNPTQYEDPDFWNFKTYDCSATSIGLHAANIVLAMIEIMLGFAVSIMSCVGLCTMRRAAGQKVIYAAGPVPDGTQGNIVIMQGTPGVQGSQPQVFVAQNPGAAGAPVQLFYPTQVPPAYQVDPGAASGVQEEKKDPIPADSV